MHYRLNGQRKWPGTVTDELQQRTDNKERSQLRSIGRQGESQRRLGGTLNDMSARALEEIQREQRAAARTRRLSGLRQYRAAADAAAAMPF